jgi:hypothetical protein
MKNRTVAFAACALIATLGLICATSIGYGQRRSTRYRGRQEDTAKDEKSIKVDGFWLAMGTGPRRLGREKLYLSVPEPKIESDGSVSFPSGTKVVPSLANQARLITPSFAAQIESRQTYWIRLLIGRDLKPGERIYVHAPTIDVSDPVKVDESAVRVKP